MKRPGIIPLVAVAVALFGCADASDPLAPAAPAAALASMAQPADVSGTYDAVVDFSTLRLTPTGRNCRLVVDGMLVFSGAIEGVARGTTTALIFAPCSDVAVTPPGTYRDVFTSELHFVGTVNGVPAEAKGLYQGVTLVGGEIEGHVHFSNGVAGVVVVDAVVAVGGSYEGRLVVHPAAP